MNSKQTLTSSPIAANLFQLSHKSFPKFQFLYKYFTNNIKSINPSKANDKPPT